MNLFLLRIQIENIKEIFWGSWGGLKQVNYFYKESRSTFFFLGGGREGEGRR